MHVHNHPLRIKRIQNRWPQNFIFWSRLRGMRGNRFKITAGVNFNFRKLFAIKDKDYAVAAHVLNYTYSGPLPPSFINHQPYLSSGYKPRLQGIFIEEAFIVLYAFNYWSHVLCIIYKVAAYKTPKTLAEEQHTTWPYYDYQCNKNYFDVTQYRLVIADMMISCSHCFAQFPTWGISGWSWNRTITFRTVWLSTDRLVIRLYGPDSNILASHSCLIDFAWPGIYVWYFFLPSKEVYLYKQLTWPGNNS